MAMDVHKESAVPAAPRVYRTFADLLATPAGIICIDIPIGLSDGPRACDLEARRAIGHPGGSRVFRPLCREALAANTYGEACEISRGLTGKAISQQAFHIRRKIAEVDGSMMPALQERVREVHPEVCFRALTSDFLPNKKTAPGRALRWQLLRSVCPTLPESALLPAGLHGECGLDDYLDALVAAWTGVCILRRTARRIPEPPQIDEHGLRMEIWRPATAR